MKSIYLMLALGFVLACSPSKKNGEKTPEELSEELFEGSYLVGDDYHAIVYTMHRTFEVEMQIFAEPVMFYFDEVDSLGNYLYLSDNQSMSFLMEPNHKKGIFNEINEPSLKVVKE
ncbi:hypothetical protein SAMN04488028_101956 [Reichenbachiella agariperforans]|uniref:Uncharacterized protein n=1 Tax=Reichenbachiella agariperforans TaxID=156994 RepID=A0A1M6LGP4_REIAG|nr:hypothetical protein [Reichenbachiella agariperforans]SHJ70394.1 hypothetical protein SAMN04488028_101956 [Reichenbachiella agariperforans]